MISGEYTPVRVNRRTPAGVVSLFSTRVFLRAAALSGHEFLDGRDHVRCILEEGAHGRYLVLHSVEHVLNVAAGDCLDAAYSGGDRRLGDYLQHTDTARRGGMRTAAELYRVSEADGADLVPVFFPEEGHGAHSLGLGDGDIAELLALEVGADQTVDHPLHLAQLLRGDLLIVGEVEPEIGGADIRAFLLDVSSEYGAQGLVQEVGGRVVVGSLLTLLSVHHSVEAGLGLRRDAVSDMDAEVIFLYSIDDIDFLAGRRYDVSAVPDLSAALGIERSTVEDELENFLALGLDSAVLDYLHIGLQQVVAYEGVLVGVGEHHPVPGLHGCGVAGPGLLLAQFLLELLQVDAVSVLAGYQLAQVDRETVGVVEGKGILAGYPHGIRVTFHDSVDQADTLGEGTQKGFLLLPDNVLDKSLLLNQLRISLTHDIHKYRHEAAQERLIEAQEGVAVAHGPAGG